MSSARLLDDLRELCVTRIILSHKRDSVGLLDLRPHCGRVYIAVRTILRFRFQLEIQVYCVYCLLCSIKQL